VAEAHPVVDGDYIILGHEGPRNAGSACGLPHEPLPLPDITKKAASPLLQRLITPSANSLPLPRANAQGNVIAARMAQASKGGCDVIASAALLEAGIRRVPTFPTTRRLGKQPYGGVC
jgi:hypothetical protein